jgi:hypothetical protein
MLSGALPCAAASVGLAPVDGRQMSWMKARMGRVSRQRRHSRATLDWECLIRTVARNLPETDHNRQAVHRPGRAPLKPLTFGAAESTFKPRFP